MLKLFFKIICCFTLLGFFFPPAKASEPPRPDQLKILLDSAHLNFKKLKIEEGLHYATLAENMALELSDSASLLEIHLLKANLFFEKRNILKAEEEYVKTERLAAEQKDTLKLIKAISGQANILTFQGESLKALVLSYKAKEIAVDFDKEAYIGVLANMSNSLVKLGQYDNALKILVETRDHFEKTGNDRSLGIVYNNIGELYREHLKNFELAKEHYLKAIKLNKKIQDQFQLSMNYGNLGINYKGAGQLDSALYFLQLSQSLKEKIGDKGGLAVTHYNTGEAYLEVGDYKKAIRNYEKTLQISEENGILMGFFYSYQGLGKAWLNLHKPKLALQYLEKAKTVSDQVNNPEMNVTLDQAFYQYYKKTGDYSKAMVILETLQHTRDSVHQKLREQDFTDLRTVYEKELSERENKVLKAQHAEDLATIGLKERTEKFYLVFAFLLLSILAVLFFYYKQRRVLLKRAEQANAKLQMQNKQLEEQERSLNELNKTKDKIFSVLGHDLRAPLTSVLGCIQVLKYDEISSGEKEKVIGLLENEVDLTLKSLEDILLWSRIQMDKSISEKKEIDLFKLLKEITQLYKPLASRKEVEIILEAEENQILLGDPHQVKSIMANLISNAIKFSPEKNAVTITLKDRDGQIEIRVNDNGTGIDPEIIENLNNPKRKLSTAGTKGEVGMGVGLSLIKEFIDANEGSLEFEKGFPTGTSAIVRFPGVQSMITSLAF